MNERAKYTPGPWECRDGIVVGRDKDRNSVSFDIFDPFDWPGDEQEALANAHLIAAAPEMLEALKVAQEYLSHSLGSPNYKGENPYPIIEAAIAKAEDN